MHIGVIGSGEMGGHHVANLLRRGGVTVTVTDIDLDRAAEVAGPAGAVVDDPDRLIGDPTIDGIVIAFPDGTHAGYTLACLRAGKPVLVEKPLADTVEDAAAVLDAEAALGRRLVQLGFMREFDHEHQAIRDELARGVIGQPLVVRAIHANLDDPKGVSVEEVMLSSAIHDLHTLRFVTGQEIREVTVRTVAGEGGRDLIRYAAITCRLEPTLGEVAMNIAAGYGYDVQVEVTGERGIIRTEGRRGPHRIADGSEARSVPSHWLDWFEIAYRNEIDAWMASLTDGRAVGPSAWDGYATVVAAHAGIESAQSGEPVDVELNAKPALY